MTGSDTILLVLAAASMFGVIVGLISRMSHEVKTPNAVKKRDDGMHLKGSIELSRDQMFDVMFSFARRQRPDLNSCDIHVRFNTNSGKINSVTIEYLTASETPKRGNLWLVKG